MPKTLYVSDLDGTLLNRQDRLPDFTVSALNRLLGEGMLFTFATARSWHSAHLVTEGLMPGLPWIVHNGAFMSDGLTGRRSHEVFFSPQEAEHILSAAQELDLWPLVYAIIDGREQVLYRSDRLSHPGLRHYAVSRQGDPRLCPVDTAQALHAQNIYYFTFIDDKAPLSPLWDRVGSLPWLNSTFQRELYREEYWLELTPGQATKAHAALRLKAELGCDKLVAFGDAMNDLPLFRAADECYAVENAMPEVKAAATGIIGGCEASGVAKFLLSLEGKT